ncbi:MAG: hypothetical protein H8D87_12150, partial [Deltaproteobacteria bacterium]|nr:hypothetical protein [Candidatus Desulfobacula maris]
MKKVIVVKTDDPEKKQFNLVVTGPVEKIVDINPESVYLKGNSGDTLEAVVNITPFEKYPFLILGMETRGNAGIQTSLIESKDDKKSWQIKIKSTSDMAQNLYDVLTLKTDSQYIPTLT